MILHPLLRVGLGLLIVSEAGFGSLSDRAIAQVPEPPEIAQMTPPNPTGALSGGAVVVGSQRLAVPWQQRGDRIGIADIALMQTLGVDLQNTQNPQQQPVQWFSDTATALTPWYSGGYRYLDITDWARQHNWQLTPSNNGTLTLQAPTGQVLAARRGRQSWGDRIVLDVDRPLLWGLEEQQDRFTLTVTGQTGGGFVANSLQDPGNALSGVQVRSGGGQLVLQGQVDTQARVRVWSLSNPPRIVIDVRQDTLPRDILWAPGVRWQAGMVSVGNRAFSVHQVRLNLRQSGVALRPLWASEPQVPGITPLITLAQRHQAVAAINAGFFNRNNQLPLGAVRRDGRWISGPILNRGAIAWNDQGRAVMNRLFLAHTLTTRQGQSFTVGQINSGYVQAGIGLYTPDWGSAYSPILDGETLVSVGQNQVARQSPGGAAGQGSVPIPIDGYLLAVRSFSEAARSLVPGTSVTLTPDLRPPEFIDLPHAMGGGPLLLKDQRMVLNPQTEGFSDAFATQAAPRSAIGIAGDGQILLVAIHHSPGGRGPTLTETAQIMAQLGSVDALNLDGGSSASLYLGGTLINRHPQTVGRIHNALGVYITP